MYYKQFEIWLADLNPPKGAEPGKIRPVLIIQSDLLNSVGHPSTIICPLTTKLNSNIFPIRVRIPKGEAKILEESDILLDQIRSIDNKRFKEQIGMPSPVLIDKIKNNLSLVLDLQSE